MVGKKHLTSLSNILGFISILMIITLLLSACSSSNDSKNMVSIGISQIVEHPALDSARAGFIHALKEKGYEEGKNLNLDIQFAQGDIALTTTIAQNFVSQKKDLILAISTPSAQSAHNSTKDIPVLFTAVTDPVYAGLVQNPDAPEGNVTGTSDLSPVAKQLELGMTLIPNTKKVGILFNTSELNSQLQVDIAKESAAFLGIEIIEIPVTNTSEFEPALNAKIKGIDFLFLPSDNLVASNMPIISKIAMNNRVPIIGVDEPMIKNGALACEGLDYYKLGHQTGIMAAEILSGKSIKDTPVSMLKETQLIINEDAAEELGINIPDELLKRATLVKGAE
ncbi:putative ABC transport system substrate-binding protein [Proteiniborus ethanoligenes]|uniref:Putative ABC transport system substrate-binding protein n=1 Tax=Proteiniborus ethanoligenes TaxID=415015 RepID=A0A1H3MBJ0_9FIRM|nr:ABC transporter substrate-binding protein [Proteiniborus ethanoligenes]SDY73684.1 putative ABC transport system substrate-binding protein [Proteiniborus ethanoligenes]